MDDDALVGRDEERALRRERRSVHGDVDRPVRVALDERANVADVENRRAVVAVHPLERRLGAHERPAVELDDPLHVRRPQCRAADGHLDETVGIVDGQRTVEAPLEADGRRDPGAHARAAQRTGDVPREDLDAVRQFGEPVQRHEEVRRSLARLDGEVGARGIADEQGVAGEHEPRLVAAASGR